MPLSLSVTWVWQSYMPNQIHVRYTPEGVDFPAQSLIAGHLILENEGVRKAELLANILAQKEERPKPLDIGDQVIEGAVNKIEELERGRDFLRVTLQIQYPPNPITGGFPGRSWAFEQLSRSARNLLEEIDRYALKEAYTHVYSKFGGGEVDAVHWKASKREVFISYRSSWESRAWELFHALGDYEDATVFLPRINKVDMQAGSWVRQLEQFIKEALNFIPLLTPDYLAGPVARQEIDLALRLNFEHSDARRLVPVLIEGEVSDYKDTFLGGYHIYDARGEEFTEQQIRDIADLLLGITRNPYEGGSRE